MNDHTQLLIVLTVGEASALLARFGARDPTAESPALAKIRTALVGATTGKLPMAKAVLPITPDLIADLPPLRAHDYPLQPWPKDGQCLVRGAASKPAQVCDAVDPQAQRHVRPGPRAKESSSSSSLDDYTPWRDEAGGIYK